ncbi:hypothetical protein [Thiothrix winogradskyi]|uniref:Uncharacterized protein n=1 Tax=Thiothrix winogradskyi TaxID=96472 RepID=A0ABY3SXY8_9GAMM|nr:hypothetical protein [Thiothrix winogradskyi]UJS24396.1 hypothetical protein L2Y54_21100 [Thiothrix winogradskyi]
MFKLPFKLALLMLAVVSAGILWQQTQLLVLALTRIDPLPDARAMLAEERYAEAADYLSFFMNYEYVSQNSEAQSLYQEISSKRESWSYQLDKLGEGLLSGTSDETIGKVAGVATDFFVIGDIRDLAEQGVNLAQGEEVDEILVALATLGVVASTAQVASGAGTVATGGVAAPSVVGSTVVKSGLIALKTAKKLGKLPPWLGKTIVKTAKTAKQSKSLEELTGFIGDVNSLANTRGGFKLIGNAENAADLRRMAKFADAFGSHSATIYHIGGSVAVDVAQRSDKLGNETIKLATTFGQGGLKLLDDVGALKFTKFASRGTKIAYKGDFFDLLVKLLLMVPTWLLYFFVIFGAVVWIPRRMFSALGRQLYHGSQKPSKVINSPKVT